MIDSLPSPRRVVVLLLLAAALAVLGGSQGKDSGEARLLASCERCHLDVWPEWKASGHARAWTNPRFQAAIAGREDGGAPCARCHAPAAVPGLSPGSLPAAREQDRELGVHCLTCHLEEGKYYGPVPSPAHGGAVVHEAYRRSDWCRGCHGPAVGDPHGEHWTGFLASPAHREDEITCQHCHMPAVTRQLAEAKRPLKGLQPPQPCRAHGFGMARDAEGIYTEAATLTGELGDRSLALRITPHRGHPLVVHPGQGVRLEVTPLGPDGAPLGGVVPLRHRFPREGEQALAPGVERALSLPLAPAAAVEVRLRRVDDAGESLAELARARLVR